MILQCLEDTKIQIYLANTFIYYSFSLTILWLHDLYWMFLFSETCWQSEQGWKSGDCHLLSQQTLGLKGKILVWSSIAVLVVSSM